jgi:hypothetical protein
VKAKGGLWGNLLSFHHVGPGPKLRSPALAAGCSALGAGTYFFKSTFRMKHVYVCVSDLQTVVSHRMWGSNGVPLEKHGMLLTAEPPLQPWSQFLTLILTLTAQLSYPPIPPSLLVSD